MSPLLKGEQMALVRGGRLLFEGLDIELGAGDALHLTGPNGSGKSSLIRLVAGLLRPDAGRIDAVRATCSREADGGDAEALYQLALMDLGLAGRFEPDVAVPRIRKAAEQGVTEAQYWMAWQSEAGPLLSNDTATALAWYRRAAEANHRLALDRLATAYEKGELGLEPDPREATVLRARIHRCDQ